jgi:hypothetical protein
MMVFQSSTSHQPPRLVNGIISCPGVIVSYDLFFRSRSPDSPFSRDDFVRHLTGRSRYQVKESQAWYSNEDSGVYFAFDYSVRDEDPGAEDESDSSLIPVAFNLNYFRPHAFGLEAEPEVAAFVRAFNLRVSDPQMSGMGDGEYSAEGFLSGWNASNAFGYRTIVSQDLEQTFLTLPSSRIKALWRWNFDREERQNEIADTAFVPRIFFFDAGGKVQTGVAWGDGIPILLPSVDLVLAPRQRLAPRSWFRSKEDIVVFSWPELDSILRPFRKRSGELDSFELFYEATPTEIERVFRAKPPPPDMPKGVAFDQILDRELLEQARGQLTNG